MVRLSPQSQSQTQQLCSVSSENDEVPETAALHWPCLEAMSQPHQLKNNNNIGNSANLCKYQNFKQKWSGIPIWIGGLIRIRISPKMLWIHYLLGVCHFAKCCTNQAVTAWEMLINHLKLPILHWWGKWKLTLNPYLGLEPHQKLVSSSNW